MDLDVEFEFPEVRVGTLGSVVVTVWYSEASIRGLEAQRAAFQKAVGRYGAASSLNVSVTVPRSPPEESLRWLKDNAEPTTDTTIESVVVLLSRGLSAVLARSYLAAVSLFSPQKLNVVRTLAEAVTIIQQAPRQTSSVAANPMMLAILTEFVERPAPV